MALSSTGIEAFISSRSTREVIVSQWINGLNVKVFDDCTVEIVEYRGMDEASAKAKAAALKSSSLADYCITSGGVGAAWLIAPQAKGTVVRASCQRQGTSRMFTVTKETETHVCSNSAGWSEYTP